VFNYIDDSEEVSTIRPSSLPPMASQNVVHVALRGESILTNPRYNKGTAFTMNERKQFGLVGRLPHKVNTLDDQCRRAYDQLLSRDAPLRKNSFLQSLKEQNSVLFYQLLLRHLRELLPIVYTPTEVCMHVIRFFLDSQSKAVQADAIANYSHLFRRSGGLYLTFDNQDSMEEDFVEQIRGRDIDLVVCSDAEAILGIGDQGVGVCHVYLSP
jgi:malate dehydrogenase (oxaloacetate-decarboxylating)